MADTDAKELSNDLRRPTIEDAGGLKIGFSFVSCRNSVLPSIRMVLIAAIAIYL